MNALYARLRTAVRAYDAALRKYGLVRGDQPWIDPSPELDRLWDAVLEAAQPEPEETTTP